MAKASLLLPCLMVLFLIALETGIFLFVFLYYVPLKHTNFVMQCKFCKMSICFHKTPFLYLRFLQGKQNLQVL